MFCAKVVPRSPISARVLGIAPIERKSWSSVIRTITLGRSGVVGFFVAACTGAATTRIESSAGGTKSLIGGTLTSCWRSVNSAVILVCDGLVHAPRARRPPRGDPRRGAERVPARGLRDDLDG